MMTYRSDTVTAPSDALNTLGSVIISNTRRGNWQYHFRDLALMVTTLGLWFLVLSQTYVQMVSTDSWADVAFLVHLFEIIGVNFLIVFALVHFWVLYERLLHSLRQRRQRRRNARVNG
ncbi:hypothetical protein [Halomonas urumqiensis]|uniref:Uncharacterized protein n=1 Tax=Halomonas urumqiensis TaxID=1684789 RepID=A0A2N7UDC0_9GAMM|nr:hypothetical protein [Halomonas urumqiensis]PMR78385.1 hypothetical protein C1H70_16675 [Halomonas urumqiensis]PTB03531.1 hypothetical protein C6V82_03310 [Halomonas urumqiensis]GHE20272.1 hypothetical protein GCM10017767_07930 [Halomonas urumqiensis]